ncbi:MAG TPA: molybdopterin dinucleotide binding domain-containing protein, partial [Acidimicrobiales bacterium]|nr:molybdopterin dinucleotide binding domain-containing protein [Acidimicrobiales bacterium]
AMRAMLMVAMLLGSVGAAGGTHIDFTWKVHDNYQKLDTVKIKDPPYDFMLKDSKYFPINTGLPGLVAKVMVDPGKYGVEKLPRVVIVHMANPLVSFPDRRAFLDAWGKFEFVTVISPWLSETADYFADVVLPAATMEKYEGPIKADDPYVDAVTVRLPVGEPIYESRGEIDIYLSLAEAMGVLGGEKGYLANINTRLALGAQALPLDVKPTAREVLDRWARAQGIEEGLAYFEEHGVKVKGPRAPAKMYGYVTDPPFGGLIHRLYGESLLRYQEEMRAKGAEEIYWQDYTALPVWREPTYTRTPPAYDLHLISYKVIENKQSRSSFNALLAELMPQQRLDINPATARRKGIGNGKWVQVESRHALTGETRRVRVRAHYTEGIRPDTVGLPHGFGLWTHSVSRGMGPSANELYFTGEGYVANTADQAYLVMVRVTPASDGSE